MRRAAALPRGWVRRPRSDCELIGRRRNIETQVQSSGSDAYPYFTLFTVVQRTPAENDQLSSAALETLPESSRPDKELLEAVLGVALPSFRPPLLRVMVTAAEALSVLVEHNYFDLDFRSEYAYALAGRYGTIAPPHTARLHFFSRALSLATFFDTQAAELNGCYLGYSVLRPFGRGSVGRTLLRPPSAYPGLQANSGSGSQELERRVRTVVEEDIQLFGRSLTARGVPFMEQDGHLLRCAHVVSWQTHYTAVLRGLVPRRPSAAFYVAGSGIIGNRTYPSRGLTAQAIVEVLSRFDLPPDPIDVKLLRSPSADRTYYRDELPESNVDEWWQRNLTSAACRYLNSGVPLVLTLRDHAVLLCGYVRAWHLTEEALLSSYTGKEKYQVWGDRGRNYDPDDVVAFVAHDDQRGPYTLLPLDQVLTPEADGGRRVNDPMLIVPRCSGQWLSGEDAQQLGWHLMTKKVDELTEKYDELDWSGEPESFKADALRGWPAMRVSLRDRQLCVRSFVTTSSDFKAAYRQRCNDSLAERAVQLARMPKFVWVVEALVREQLALPQPVVAQAVLDASSASKRDAALLLLQLPGIVVVQEPEWSEKEKRVTFCATRRWESARWDRHSIQASVASRAKGAIPAESLIGLN